MLSSVLVQGVKLARAATTKQALMSILPLSRHRQVSINSLSSAVSGVPLRTMPWLMKAEPDSRIVKGKDVKFSVDDFEELGTSQWDGVRNHEAKKIMKERMKLGDKVLFYHSNTKTPGVYGLAEVAREGYPDYTAFDETHPYYDAKSKQEAPTWFMVDVKFTSRVQHPPTLHLIKTIATLNELPDEISYIGSSGHKAIKEMGLVNRGRLSVQPVTEEAYNAVIQLGDKGGWEALTGKPAKVKSKETVAAKAESKPGSVKEEANIQREEKPAPKKLTSSRAGTVKRTTKALKTEEGDEREIRRSKRSKAA